MRIRTFIPAAKRFWSHVDKDGPIPGRNPELGPCWVWTGGKNRWGYASIQLGQTESETLKIKNIAVHVFALTEALGRPITPGQCVLHACDNPACVRNDTRGWYEIDGVFNPMRGHLLEGSNAQNVLDRNAKGRVVSNRIPPRMYTNEEILGMRALKSSGKTVNEVAVAYGAPFPSVRKILRCETHKNL
jgi:hypothetical protein